MTQDFIDDLARACEKEGCPYILIVQQQNGKRINVRNHLNEWKKCNPDNTLREDISQLLGATVFND